MDLGRESSALESVEDNEGVAYPSRKLDNADESKVGTNGPCAHDKRDNGIVNTEAGVGSPAVMIGKSTPSSPNLSPSPCPSPGAGGATKGKGLKKWRRIKRDVIKEGGSNVDATKLLKRGLPNSGANLNKPVPSTGGMKLKKDGSVSSSNALLRSPGNGVDIFGNSRNGPGVGDVTDSGNSEDRSSKSSTAASAPKMTGYALEKNSTMRNLNGNNLGNLVQRGQTGKGQSETSKKLRGNMVKIEKENSHSSMESDSRSSNFVFMQGINSVTSNGRQSGRTQNYDEENSDEVQGSERQPSDKLQVGSSGKNGVAYEGDYQEELAADSSWGTKEENENNGPSRDEDPLLDSISSLQSAKEALEKEIQKFMEIGKEDSTPDDSIKGVSFEQLQSSDLGNQSFDSLELEVNNLKQTMEASGIKLDDAEALLKVKEAQIRELQESTSLHTPARMETGFSKKVHEENDRDLEIELDDLFKQKIEAEVEYLAISRTVLNLKVTLADQISILKKQKAEQTQMMNKLGESKSRAAKLKAEAEKLENYCEDIVSTDETVELKTRICKYTTCFFLQSMLLLTIFILLFGQLLRSDSNVVPT